MLVAPIVPTPLLPMLKDLSYQMCLYHVVKSNPEYAEFYRQEKARGAFVIMDNGAAEGVNPSPEELMPVYEMVQPSEIVLPDVVYDKEETLTRTAAAYTKYVAAGLHHKYQFMAVPQGNTFTEWCECLSTMLSLDHVTTIGVSKFVTPKFQKELGENTNVRLECVDMILSLAAKRKPAIQIHLLGCWDTPEELKEISQTFRDKESVRGTDSAIAYVFARAGVPYSPELKRPDNDEIDFHNGTVQDVELLKHNIIEYLTACS